MLEVLGRNERAVPAIPNGQLITTVAAPVCGIGAVVELVVCGADEPRVEFGAVVHPDMPMTQVVNEVEGPHHHMKTHEGEKSDVWGKPPVGDPGE